jgi:hypothetical protein
VAGLVPGERLVVVDSDKITAARPDKLARAAHGTFDNDVAVVTNAIERISGGVLKTPVDDLRGF